MKRGVFDVLRRGLDNTLANWQLILLRLGETLLFGVIVVVAVIAVVLPIVVAAGVRLANLSTPDDLFEAMLSLATNWMLFVWIVLGVLVIAAILIAIHSFVEAGCARVYVDGERIAGPEVAGLRSRFRVFSMERWFAGGRDGWWTVFWIYNLAWSVGGAILMIPLLPTVILMFVLREQAPVAIGIGCLGLALTLLLMLAVGITIGMWTNRAIGDWAIRRAGARDALSAGWTAVRGDLGRHLLVAIAVFVVAMAGSAFFSSFSFFATFGEVFNQGRSPILPLAMVPIRIFAGFLNSIFSAVVSSWFLAAYSSLAVEGRS